MLGAPAVFLRSRLYFLVLFRAMACFLRTFALPFLLRATVFLSFTLSLLSTGIRSPLPRF